MKRVVAEYPYDDYYLYIVFHKKEGRRYANLISIENGKKDRQTISYARYLMSVKAQRILNKDEHVDHIDNDKLNDSIDNLQILSIAENNRKEAFRHGRAMVELKCPNCKLIFTKPKNQTFLANGGTFTCCCKRCSRKFLGELQRHPNNSKVLKALRKNVVREYRSHGPLA